MCQSIVAGGVYFDEFAELGGWRAAFFSAGLVAAIAGAVGMGCASFVAEQHVMMSYTILPGARRTALLQDGSLNRTKCRGLSRGWRQGVQPPCRQHRLAILPAFTRASVVSALGESSPESSACCSSLDGCSWP